uniref:Secreted protein n=1 Tax=Steinernema glaseri TaxID=37863 RepID=A0A1I7YLC1_9BILA
MKASIKVLFVSGFVFEPTDLWHSQVAIVLTVASSPSVDTDCNSEDDNPCPPGTKCVAVPIKCPQNTICPMYVNVECVPIVT